MGTWNTKAVGGERDVESTTSTGREYHAIGEGFADVDTAKAGLYAYAAPTVGDLVLDGVEVEDLGNGLYEGIARYASAATVGGAGTTVFSFNTSGGTRHITTSEATTGYPKTGAKGVIAPDVKNTIGPPDGDGMVAGVDIVFPQYEFTITKYVSDSEINAFRAVLFATTGKTNADVFYGMQPGECLFRGCEGGKRSGGDWELALHFTGSQNRTGVKIGPITLDSVKGFEYIDARYEHVTDTAAAALVKWPQYVYVHQVYKTATFAALGV